MADINQPDSMAARPNKANTRDMPQLEEEILSGPEDSTLSRRSGSVRFFPVTEYPDLQELDLPKASPDAESPEAEGRVLGEHADEALAVLKKDGLIQSEDLKQILNLARAVGVDSDQFPDTAQETVIKLRTRYMDDPSIEKLRALNSGETGFKTGPEIDVLSLALVDREIGLKDIVSAFRNLGVETVGAVVPKGRDENSYTWRLYYRED